MTGTEMWTALQVDPPDEVRSRVAGAAVTASGLWDGVADG
jgi:hypothetical protein